MKCDFCTEEQVYSEDVKFFLDTEPVVWDGYCKKGSGVYFQDLEDADIVNNIELSTQTLGMDLKDDDPITLMKRKWIAEEVERAKRELLFRIEDYDV